MIQVIEGDCIQVMKQMPDESINMILTDLPYGTTYAPWDSPISLDAFWAQALRLTSENSAIVLTASQPFTSLLVSSNYKMFRCEWIWNKVNGANFANTKKQPFKVHENILVFSKKQSVYNPQMVEGRINHTQGKNAKARKCETQLISERAEDNLTGLKYPKSIIVFPKHSSQLKLHSTQKPVELFEYLIRTYSEEGDTVLDCCAGSGTTGVAAKNTKRHAILIDNNPSCIQIINKRLSASDGERR
jgi:site-specific DNA-methyltransferase (adenine-specific)